MRTGSIVAAAVASLLIPLAAFACEGHEKLHVKLVPLQEAKELQKSAKATFLDANGQETRAKFGVIAGAKLLSKYNEYDAAKELPAAKDSKLVFYCASTRCTASDAAAERAVKAGYTDVSILREGIKGWVDAGGPTATPNS